MLIKGFFFFPLDPEAINMVLTELFLWISLRGTLQENQIQAGWLGTLPTLAPLPSRRLRVSLLAQVPHCHRYSVTRAATYSDWVWFLFFQEVPLSLDREDAYIIPSQVWENISKHGVHSLLLPLEAKKGRDSGNTKGQHVEWSILSLRQWREADLLIDQSALILNISASSPHVPASSS